MYLKKDSLSIHQIRLRCVEEPERDILFPKRITAIFWEANLDKLNLSNNGTDV